ncbi:hypothetical protein [Sulfuricystis multivorans]|uniref:hypothetical protein n=1 Tax=Sulfuricystis multivorans TaxID=2211108 RepID=UPI0024DFC6A1|nr:hypothetical protein [Sulfuricystis multivorans]
MKKLALTASFLTAAVVAASAFAQMGPGGGMGPGGMGKGRFAWNQTYTPGWTLMTPEERTAWQAQMREVKTYEECVATQEAHRKVMEERAKEKGVQLMPPRRNGCDVMKARGIIK